jgi:cell division protein FtsB
MSEVDTELMREFWASKIPGLTTNLLDLAREAIVELADALDAARAELERKEAEAAVLRDALLFVQPYMEGAHFNRVNAREIIWAQARKALNTTQAGADLLERVRQLEAENEELEQQVTDWQASAMLNGPHGDPEGITPLHNERQVLDMRERVRQLEGEVEELRGLAPIALAAVEYVEEEDDEDNEELVLGAWHDLEHAVQVYRADHQGTGASAGKGVIE